MRHLLSLVGIFKNEATSILATLESAAPFVDCFVLVDTGSTDGTQDIIKKFLEDKLGGLFTQPFVDFSTARNRVLQLAEENGYVLCSDGAMLQAVAPYPVGAKYTLMLSADETLIGGEALRTFLENYKGEETAFNVELRTDHGVVLSPRVRKTGSHWHYEGVVHEQLVNRTEKKDVTVQIPGVFIEHKASDEERRFKRMQEFDVHALQEEIERNTSPEERGRLMLLLAQTYEFLGVHSDNSLPGNSTLTVMMLAMSYYRRRFEIGGDAEEVNYAYFKFLNVASTLNIYDAQDMLRRLEPMMETTNRPEVEFMYTVALLETNQTVEAFGAAHKTLRRCDEFKPLKIPCDVSLVKAQTLRLIAHLEKQL